MPLFRNACLPIAFTFLVLLQPLRLQAQSIAFSFDDGLDPRRQPAAAQWNRQLLQALADQNVQAMLLPAGKNVDSAEGLALVRAWGEAGHQIGNHTYQHRNLNASSMQADVFLADVARADALLGQLPGWTRRLRFPYLKEGDTPAKRDAVRTWMREHDYAPAAVSIDASDWYYDQRLAAWRAAHPGADTGAHRDAYLAHLWARASYYDGLARQLGYTDVPHVLLLHTNAINAAFLPEVIAMFRAKGWRITTPQDAYADPLYASQPEVLPAGEGLLWALAKQAGIGGLRYPAEDGTYEQPLLDRLEQQTATVPHNEH